MNYPWDYPPDPRFIPGGMGSAMGPQMPAPGASMNEPSPEYFSGLPPVSEPDYLGEMQGTQFPMPNDFWARVSQGTGGQGPFGQMQLPQKFTGLEALAALLSGFANAKTQQAGRRTANVEQQNAQSSANARALAQHRWGIQRDREREAAQMRANIAESRAKAASAPPSLDAPRFEETKRHNLAMEKTAQDRLGIEGIDEPTIYADMLVSGELASPTGVPQRYRAAALQIVRNRGDVVLQPKARASIQELNAARKILDRLKALNSKIVRGEGFGRIKEGGISEKEALEQKTERGITAALYKKLRKGMLSTLSRASGERGVLTNQDIQRVMETIPDLFQSRGLSDQLLGQSDTIFDEIQNSVAKSYTEPWAGIGAPTTAPRPGESGGLPDDAAYREYLKVAGGKK